MARTTQVDDQRHVVATFKTGSSLLMSVDECASLLGCSGEAIYALVDTGKWIGSCRSGRKPMISRAAFERLYLDGVWHSDEEPVRNPFLVRRSTER